MVARRLEASARSIRHVPGRLVDRDPQVSPERLLADLVPPPHFASVSFASYEPDPAQPSQAAAVAALQAFAGRLADRPGRRWRRRAAPPEERSGVYLDGGFGVGKTHLLASLWHVAPGPRAYGTFVEYTNLVGALGFAEAQARLSTYRLVCIDEFELDDPGDTVLMSTLLGNLVAAGVRLAATSNTLPERLGEERFAAEDFLREIQGLSAHFDVLRIDGDDYRHRGAPQAPAPWDGAALLASAQQQDGATLDDWRDLQRHLGRVHPSRYSALLDGVTAAHFADVRTLTDQVEALRTVVLVDRLYDRDIPVRASGVPWDRLFSEEMLRGGYRKKYRRALSRICALAREGDTPPGDVAGPPVVP
ncbi:MAG: cell division protein ZapE [Actinobacteria bacterium]|nr:cell division protein ZapE [Actinomycetota bacterium]